MRDTLGLFVDLREVWGLEELGSVLRCSSGLLEPLDLDGVWSVSGALRGLRFKRPQK